MRNRSLDGLRAFAVLAVVANHVGLPLTQGGYLGVDVFFVLSGYLITNILVREHNGTGRVALGRFYLRRALRLYPALLAVIALTGVLVAMGLIDGQGYGLHAVIAAVYLQDLAITFGWARGLGPLNHTWSLAIEEQFYLLWPLVIILARGRPRTVLLVAALLTLLGFVAMQLYVESTVSPTSAVYYRPEARAAALLLGCAVATAPRLATLLPRWSGTAAAVVLCAAIVLSPQANTRVVFAISMPVVWLATAVLIVVLVRGSSWLSRLLGVRPLAYLGLISYGVYLYHPVIIEAVGTGTGLRRSAVAVLAVPLALVVAAASYRWIETPALRLKDRYGSTDVGLRTSADIAGVGAQRSGGPACSS